MKIKTALLALVVLVTTSASCGDGEDTSGVLLYMPDGSQDLEFMLTEELGVMKDLLEQSGFEVAVTTVSGELVEAGSASLTPDLPLSEVVVADYAGFILPCMAAADRNYQQPEDAVAMVRTAVAEGKPVAAQLGGVLTLAEAGVLEGKEYAFSDVSSMNPRMFPSLEGGVYAGTGVVQDGNIITSGLCPYMARYLGVPDGTEELTRTLIDSLAQAG